MLRGAEVSRHWVSALAEGAERSTARRGALAPVNLDEPVGLTGEAHRSWLSWTEYATFLDSLSVSLGGEKAVDTLVADLVSGSLVAWRKLRGRTDLQEAAAWVVDTCIGGLHRSLGYRWDTPKSGGIRLEISLPSIRCGSRIFAHVVLGLLRGACRISGLEPEISVCEVTDHRLVVLLHVVGKRSLRPERAAVRQAARAVPPSAARSRERAGLLGGTTRAGPLEAGRCGMLDSALLELSPASAAALWGQPLAECTDLGSLARRLGELVSDRFCASQVAVWAPVRRSPAVKGRRSTAGDAEAGIVDMDRVIGEPWRRPSMPSRWPLLVGGWLVGVVEVDVGSPSLGAPVDFVALLPWLAIGLDRCLQPSRSWPAPETGVLADGASASAAACWRLTSRETDVLALLVRGLSNKEIACSLGCSVRTVDVHVSHVLTKSGMGSRGVLAASLRMPPVAASRSARAPGLSGGAEGLQRGGSRPRSVP